MSFKDSDRFLKTDFRVLAKNLLLSEPPSLRRVSEIGGAETLSYSLLRVFARRRLGQIGHSAVYRGALAAFAETLARFDAKREGRTGLQRLIAAARALAELYAVDDLVFANIFEFLGALGEQMPIESDEDRAALLAAVENYIERRFAIAEALIVEYCVPLVADGDKILICSASSIIERVFIDAKAKGARFSLIVCGGESLPRNSEMARRLAETGLEVLFTHVNNAAFFIERADKVFINALSVFADGAVKAGGGSAAVAMLAKRHRKPVYAIARTVRFCGVSCDRPLAASGAVRMADFAESCLLLYDIVPQSEIGLLVTEIGLMPTHSVSVVVRGSQFDGK